MDNVIDLFAEDEPEISNEESINTFVKYFIDWAHERGIDTNTLDFKYDAALIMTVLKSLLHKKESNES